MLLVALGVAIIVVGALGLLKLIALTLPVAVLIIVGGLLLVVFSGRISR